MIIRVFQAKVRLDKIAEFKRMVQEQSIPGLTSAEGMLGYFPGEPLSNDRREFVMVTLWREIESLKKFAGENWETPVATAAETLLVEEMTAYHDQHFQTVMEGEACSLP
jgi:quinol monooxygenase YgiN